MIITPLVSRAIIFLSDAVSDGKFKRQYIFISDTFFKRPYKAKDKVTLCVALIHHDSFIFSTHKHHWKDLRIGKSAIWYFEELPNKQAVASWNSHILESRGLKQHEVVSNTVVGRITFGGWQVCHVLRTDNQRFASVSCKSKVQACDRKLTFTCSVKSSATLKVFRQMFFYWPWAAHTSPSKDARIFWKDGIF